MRLRVIYWVEHLCCKKKLALTMLLTFCSSQFQKRESRRKKEGREGRREEGRKESVKKEKGKGNEMSIYSVTTTQT